MPEKRWKERCRLEKPNAQYFGLSDTGIEELKYSQEIILNAIKRPRLVLDSAAFVWMVKKNDE